MRKQWLYAYFGGIAIFIITSIIKTLQSPEGFFNYIRTVTIGDQAPQVTYPPLPLTSLIFKICFVPCFYIGIWYLVYRAVYKKQGTRMLLFMMVANAYYGVLNAQQLLGFIRQCILIYFAMDGYAMMLNALWIFYYIIATGVAIWLMNASAKLYTINGMLHQENDV
jgi:hypothetical protein